MSKTLIYVFGSIAILGGLVFLYLRGTGAPPGVAPLTPEARAYVRSLKLGPVEMKATDSYVHQTITEIDGTIANAGGRAIRSADVYCVFYDAYGQVVLRERSAIVKAGAPVFKPGETRKYRLAFDDIPSDWNNQLPQLVIAGIAFD